MVFIFNARQYLKTNIRQVVVEIPPNICQKVVKNYFKRIEACNTSRGGRLNVQTL